ncbi:DNA helicase [Trabala vishnou gigantina nucleopolyhedrovirus]|uniref:DNA helicase n=1 Tax=Trabala vishnou gigantina nucleopolyhedrovirus TaxID=2863583 RepID=UPI002481AA70|nr:DNA helicase [Trabala vishnou gigantina nucleopolyhedrovirus]QYC92649.1 DNA helicase [Trabala vishnou gigantina nucleopolyhedrovirus]
MAIEPVSADTIFANIFKICNRPDNDILEDFDSVDCLVLKNDLTEEKRIIKSLSNFQQLIHVMSNGDTFNGQNNKPTDAERCSHTHNVLPHNWSVQGNCFIIMVKPFLELKYYDMVKNKIDFTQFLKSNRVNFANEHVKINDYVYWPHIPISYFGWRQFLKMKFDIDIGEYVPLVHNKRLGNVNLFEFYPRLFLNIELSMVCAGKKLFVNGRTMFNDDHDDLFNVTMADGASGTCKVNDSLVYSNKNFFDYLRDDINLIECKTADKYQHLIRVNLQSLRSFKEAPPAQDKFVIKERLKVSDVITASSENDEIAKHVNQCVTSVNEHMVRVLCDHDIANADVLYDYLRLSNFMNFDYLMIVVWRLIVKNNNFDFSLTDICLYLELLCERLYDKSSEHFEKVSKRCEPYTKLLPKVFTRLCNHWTLFNEENPLESLACYFAIHYLIYKKLSEENGVATTTASGGVGASSSDKPTASDLDDAVDCWNYSVENVLTCGASQEMIWKGFFKKIQSLNASLVFNGKHYVAVKKEDELYKYTEKSTAIAMSSVTFNNWKYMYFTDEGVYNVIINDYHSCTPFILGNTLMGALTKKSEKTYLPEPVIDFMLTGGNIEIDIYRIYHVAKVCRDLKTIKNNIAIIVMFDNCFKCKRREQFKINDLFREIWEFSDQELIIAGVYLNKNKIVDIIMNFKCVDCQQRKAARKKCNCINSIEINRKAFAIAIIVELFCNNFALIELVWLLVQNSMMYAKVLADTNSKCSPIVEFARYFYENRDRLVAILYNKINRVAYADDLIHMFADANELVALLQNEILNGNVDDDNDDEEDYYSKNCNNDDYDDNNDDGNNVNSENNNGEDDNNVAVVDFENDDDNNKNNNNNNHSIVNRKRIDDCIGKNNVVITNFYVQYYHVLNYLKKYNIWWDKLIVARHNDDINSWLVRFYSRVILSKMNLSEYSHFFVKNVVTGYLYFRFFTNFNYVNSRLMIHFDASLGIPFDSDKCCVYCTGEPNSGKSSNGDLMAQIVVVHKHDAETYTLSKKETDEMEANKLISQLYIINEMKECNDSFFKTTADSAKSNAVCRKYQGAQKYEANYKLMIINNKPLRISNYDKGVRNRFAIVYMAHEFEENLQFSGSVYSHIKSKKFPMEKTYHESLVTPVRLFLSHVLMYKRNKRDGYISYKNIIKNDPVHNYNLMCLDINNSTTYALIYILKVKVKQGVKPIEEEKIFKLIELATPYVEIMIHDTMKSKRNANRTPQLCSDFRKYYKKHYRENERVYFNLEMARNKNDFNTTQPTFLC